MRQKFKSREFYLLIIIAAIVAVTGCITPSFLTAGGISSLFEDSSILIILSLAQMIVMLTGGIDLSLASNIALTGMVVGKVCHSHPDSPILILIFLAVFVGLLLGMFNGFLIGYLKLPPLVVTLGTMNAYRGLTFIISNGGQWIKSQDLTENFLNFPHISFLGISMIIWLAIFVGIFMYIFLNKMRLGREIYSIGNNVLASEYVGLKISRNIFYAYCLSGLLAGLCGYLWVARFAVAYTELAQGFELQTVAAVAIGGISNLGGIGTVPGAILGALLLSLIANALPSMGISPFWQLAISGAAIIIAVIINSRSNRTPVKRILKNMLTRRE
ncbi:ABC transporter permease [bacterium]|nr:ABC transporter permease [bacterium]